MKRRTGLIHLVVLTILAACSKPAPPGPSNTPALPAPGGQAPNPPVDNQVARPAELRSDDPDHLAIQNVFARAKAAVVSGDNRALFELIPPDERVPQLCKVLGFVKARIPVTDVRTDLNSFYEVLKRHRIPTEVVRALGPDPNPPASTAHLEADWKLAEDLPGCFDEAVKLLGPDGLGRTPLKEICEGDLVLERADPGKVRGRINRFGPKTEQDPVILFEKAGTEWFVRINLLD